MDLKCENEKRECENKDHNINVLYEPNKPALPEKLWTSIKCHKSPPPSQSGTRLSPLRPSRVMGWRRI